MYSVKPVFFFPLYFCVMHCSSMQDVCIKLTWWEKTETRFESLMICSTVQPITFQNFPKATWVLACGLSEVVHAQFRAVWYWLHLLLDHTLKSCAFLLSTELVFVGPAWTPLKSCPCQRLPSVFPERLFFFLVSEERWFLKPHCGTS